MPNQEGVNRKSQAYYEVVFENCSSVIIVYLSKVQALCPMNTHKQSIPLLVNKRTASKSQYRIQTNSYPSRACVYQSLFVVLLFSCQVTSDSLWTHEMQDDRLPCPPSHSWAIQNFHPCWDYFKGLHFGHQAWNLVSVYHFLKSVLFWKPYNSLEAVNIVQRGPMYPSSSFPQWLCLIKPQSSIKIRKVTLRETLNGTFYRQ